MRLRVCWARFCANTATAALVAVSTSCSSTDDDNAAGNSPPDVPAASSEPDPEADHAVTYERDLRPLYDNSPANQPFIGGVQQAPQRVGFGEASTDEMCLNHTWVRYEREMYMAARAGSPLAGQ